MSDERPCGPAGGPWGCAKHALLERTCCQTSEVFVTEGDRRRIAEHTGRRDFFEERAPADPSYLDHEDDPAWLELAFRPDGTRPILKRAPNGDCTFLGACGCALPAEVRPLICRIYPYEYTETGLRALGDRCPHYVVPPGSTILDVLGMRREDAERWHKVLYQELRLARRAHV